MIFRKKALGVFCTGLCIVASTTSAATLTFEATTDFPVTDAGVVPYYSEAPGRQSLAINAAREDYRGKFAKAVMNFEGPSGFFDITLTTLAELDGEAPYRVLINDVLVGSVTNPEVSVDYTPVRHTFEQVVVPKGAIIAVESLANTNGKIPEGDGTAFARGRWTTLEFSNDEAETAAEDTIDLTLSASTDTRSVMVGESRTLTFDIGNAIGSAVATQPVLTLTRPRSEVGVDTELLENCTESGNDIICHLSEIPAESSEQISITLTALGLSPSALLRITVSADQTDSDTSNNSVTLSFPIEDTSVTEEPPTPETGDETSNGVDSEMTDASTSDMTSENGSGGGASGALGLILLAAMRLSRRFIRLSGRSKSK